MSEIVMATCYGASNTGQLAGAVATELAREEGYGLVCLPAVAIDKATGLDKVTEAELLVVIEGCPVMCCTKIIEDHAGPPARYTGRDGAGLRRQEVPGPFL